jgi:ferredoxin
LLKVHAMPRIVIHRLGHRHDGEVQANSNLVVRAGVRQYPHPHLRYGCGMGKCAKCASRVLAGAETLPPPNWKEHKVLGDQRLAQGYRLMCQLWVDNDLEIVQDDEPLQPLPPTP